MSLRAETAGMPGMKEDALVALGPCAVCDKKLLETGEVTFYVVEIKRVIWDRTALQRRAGLAMMMGGAEAVARALGPDEDLAKVFDGPHRVAVHESCAHGLSSLLDLVPEGGGDGSQTPASGQTTD